MFCFLLIFLHTIHMLVICHVYSACLNLCHFLLVSFSFQLNIWMLAFNICISILKKIFSFLHTIHMLDICHVYSACLNLYHFLPVSFSFQLNIWILAFKLCMSIFKKIFSFQSAKETLIAKGKVRFAMIDDVNQNQVDQKSKPCQLYFFSFSDCKRDRDCKSDQICERGECVPEPGNFKLS